MSQMARDMFNCSDYKIITNIKTTVKTALHTNASILEPEEYKRLLLDKQNEMRIWVDNCPEKLHQYLLIAAEIATISGKHEEAMDLYDKAIESARDNEQIQDEALGNELAAKFYLEKGKLKIATVYMKDAYYNYQKYGDIDKIQELEAKYSQLISDQQHTEIVNIKNTNFNDNYTRDNQHKLDLNAVIKAYQILSSERVIDCLLDKFTRIVIENSGAEKAYIVLFKEDKLIVECEGLLKDNEIVIRLSPPIHQNHHLPISVFDYVKRTEKNIILHHYTEEIFADDFYLHQNKPKSILCIPIKFQEKVVGLVYLENNLNSGIFDKSRLEIIKLLSCQFSIFLDNAQLYENLDATTKKLNLAKNELELYNHNLENKVRERTQELIDKNTKLLDQSKQLKQTLHELKITQSQLIHTEKMSSLGQLVAGVAHEINNPVNFIYGNLTYTEECSKNLLELLNIYQKYYPNHISEIEEKIESIDLNFITTDLPKLLASMKVGTNRIREIVLSLRNFSRLDEAEKKFANIHEGIDSSLMILHNQIKSKPDFCGIEVIKEYSDLPLVECFPGQLNQVFMNILTNAIDALEENTKSHQSKIVSNQLTPPQIRIITKIQEDYVCISIADNGIGMTEEVGNHIFDPFYTNKPIGKGTGLGLSISYQIIVDKHGGKLTCISAPEKGAEFIIKIPLVQ